MKINLVGVFENGAAADPSLPADPSAPVQMAKGSSATIRLQIFDRSGGPHRLTSGNAVVTLAVRRRTIDAPWILLKEATRVVDANQGVVEFDIVPADTFPTAINPGIYSYTIWLAQGDELNTVMPLSPWLLKASVFAFVNPPPLPPPPAPPAPPVVYPNVGMTVVPNVAALLTLEDQQEASQAYVDSLQTPWIYVEQGAEFAIDHITVEATFDGGNSRWVRDLQYNHLAWRTQLSDVYIDPVNGDDENQGIYYETPTLAAPLKTAMELWRRWGEAEVTAEPVSAEVSIHVLNDIVAPDEFRMSWRNGRDTYPRILGEATTTLHAGTLDSPGGFTAWTPSAAGGGEASDANQSG